ncbi:hypothetical protein CMU77_15285 [Elizabethkingia anophelis]|nr:hypothetical protein [Elizabethkingia anophelis]
MNKIDIFDLYSLVNNATKEEIVLSNCVIDFMNSPQFDIDFSIVSLYFKECVLIGNRAVFHTLIKEENKDIFLTFEDCIINCDLFIKEAKIHGLKFNNCQINSELFYITNCEIKDLSIINRIDGTETINNLLISESKITLFLDIRFTHFLDTINLLENEIKLLQINKNTFQRLNFRDCIFGENFSFKNNNILTDVLIEQSTFGNFNCQNTNFGSNVELNECEFNGNCAFERIDGNRTSVKLNKCNFNRYVYFDDANVYSIITDLSFFKEIASFQNASCHIIKFNRTHFDKMAFFTNIKIESKQELDINTIRIIKAQLLKAENKIDYLEFKKYEFELFRKSLGKRKNGSKFILWLNKITSDYNTDWVRGFISTSVYGFIFCIALYVAVFGLREWSVVLGENRFWLGYFKYMIIPNFSSPFEEEELELWWQYLIFILGKIFVTYGLYETIQSFRKYGKT